MIFGEQAQGVAKAVMGAWAAVLLVLAPQAALAQDAAEAAPVAATVAESAPPATAAQAPVPAVAEADVAATQAPASDSSYIPLGPDMIKGQPVNGNIDFQPQFTEDGEFAYKMHTYLLLPVITVICLFVLGLLLWVVARYRRGANPNPSKTTHNTLIEVVWTLVPVLILVGIAIPSITLLARQYESPPADAVTIKATGYQWYWGYTYPDNGGFEVISNMLSPEDALAAGEPAQLAVDNRLVVPANTPLRIQTTAADVIHAFAVPSLWFKLDAVPGRLNERLLTIKEPGIYYGQCSELCGVKHGYMPIAVEALPRDKWEAWVRSKGGTVAGDAPAAEPAAPAAAATAEPAAPAAAAAAAE